MHSDEIRQAVATHGHSTSKDVLSSYFLRKNKHIDAQESRATSMWWWIWHRPSSSDWHHLPRFLTMGLWLSWAHHRPMISKYTVLQLGVKWDPI
jgi:hypothetical protein